MPPADSSDEEPEAEQDTQAAELSQEQQQSQAQLTGHGAQGTIPKQVLLLGDDRVWHIQQERLCRHLTLGMPASRRAACMRCPSDLIKKLQHVQEAAGEEAMEEAGRERLQDLDRQLRENAEQLQRSAATQTGVGIASTAFGPLAVAASAQGDRPGSRAAAERR